MQTAIVRFVMYALLVYAVGYMAFDFYLRIAYGVYEEGNVLIVATRGRAWDLSAILALMGAGGCAVALREMGSKK